MKTGEFGWDRGGAWFAYCAYDEIDSYQPEVEAAGAIAAAGLI